MNDHTIALVRESFDLIEPIAPQAGALFYANLFEADPSLQWLGQRHAGYGVRDEHCDTVGAALLKTLYQGLGVAYNAEVEAAWVDVYGVLAAKMKEAAAVPA